MRGSGAVFGSLMLRNAEDLRLFTHGGSKGVFAEAVSESEETRFGG